LKSCSLVAAPHAVNASRQPRAIPEIWRNKLEVCFQNNIFNAVRKCEAPLSVWKQTFKFKSST